MKTKNYVYIIFGVICFVYGSQSEDSQTTCQVKCNSTSSCDLLFPNCGCPDNQNECNKMSLVTNNKTETNSTEEDQCCYCDEDGTHCMTEVEDTEKKGATDSARLIIVFFDECDYLNLNDTTAPQFLGLFEEAFYNWTNINTTEQLVIQNETSCTSGEVPNCGVNVAALTSPNTAARRRRSIDNNKIEEDPSDQKVFLIEEKLGESERHIADDDKVISRIRRKIGGGRMRSGTKNKKGSGSDLDLEYSAGYGFVEEVTTCGGLAVKMTLLPGDVGKLTTNETIYLLIESMLNESLTLRFSTDYEMVAEMIFYGLNNETFLMRRVPYPSVYDGPRFVPPMEVDIRPFVYASGSLVGLFLLVVTYKMIKHTIFLQVNKFTKINSDEIKAKAVLLPAVSKKEVKEESEAAPLPVKKTNFDMSFKGIPVVDNDRITRDFDWTTPIYLPGMLDPVENNINTDEHQRLTLDEDNGDLWERNLREERV